MEILLWNGTHLPMYYSVCIFLVIYLVCDVFLFLFYITETPDDDLV